MMSTRSFVVPALMLLLLLVGGCASSGPKHTEFVNRIPEVAYGQGRIYFYRISSILGAAIQPDIRINGDTVGTSIPGGFFFIDRPSGKYTVATTTEVENKIEFSLEDGQTLYIKTYIGFGLLVGRVYPELSERVQALSVMADLHYTGAPEHAVGKGGADTVTPPYERAPRRTVELEDLKDLLPAQR